MECLEVLQKKFLLWIASADILQQRRDATLNIQLLPHAKNLSGKENFYYFREMKLQRHMKPIDIHRFMYERFQPDEHIKRFVIYLK